jgi:hypothetical protein
MQMLCRYILPSVFFPAHEKLGLVQLVPEHIVEHAEVEPAFYLRDYVFGDQLDQSEFLMRRKEDTRQYITTKHLNKYVSNAKEWKKRKLSERAIDLRMRNSDWSSWSPNT